MLITCIAMNTGHQGARRAGRFFPNGDRVVLEVVKEKDADGKLTGNDPKDQVGPDGKLRADATKIGTRSYQAILDDPRIKVVQGDASDPTQDVVTDAPDEAAALKAENAKLLARIADLEKAAASSKPADAPNPADTVKGKAGK